MTDSDALAAFAMSRSLIVGPTIPALAQVVVLAKCSQCGQLVVNVTDYGDDVGDGMMGVIGTQVRYQIRDEQVRDVYDVVHARGPVDGQRVIRELDDCADLDLHTWCKRHGLGVASVAELRRTVTVARATNKLQTMRVQHTPPV